MFHVRRRKKLATGGRTKIFPRNKIQRISVKLFFLGRLFPSQEEHIETNLQLKSTLRCLWTDCESSWSTNLCTLSFYRRTFKMKNIKYTTTNKCKSKVFLTNFSILLKCYKVFPCCSWMERGKTRKTVRKSRQRRERESDERRKTERLRAGGNSERVPEWKICLVIIFGHRKSLFYCSIYYDFYGWRQFRTLMDY